MVRMNVSPCRTRCRGVGDGFLGTSPGSASPIAHNDNIHRTGMGITKIKLFESRWRLTVRLCVVGRVAPCVVICSGRQGSNKLDRIQRDCYE